MTEEKNPPFKLVVGIWFSLWWRTMLWIIVFIVPAIILNLGIAVCLVFLVGPEKETIAGISTAIGAVLGLIAGCYASFKGIRGVLGKSFSGHRLTLVRNDGAAV